MARIQIDTIKSKITWACFLSPYGNYVGECPALGLTTEGSTPDELESMIRESMALLFNGLLEDNELEEFLRERDWTMSRSAGEASEAVDFDIPYQILKAGRTGDSQGQCH